MAMFKDFAAGLFSVLETYRKESISLLRQHSKRQTSLRANSNERLADGGSIKEENPLLIKTMRLCESLMT